MGWVNLLKIPEIISIFKDKRGWDDLSYKYIPEEIMHQQIYRNVLFIQEIWKEKPSKVCIPNTGGRGDKSF